MSELLNKVRHLMRARHYSYRTEKTYVNWIKRYIFFHHIRHPSEMGAEEISTFLTHLAVDKQVSSSTQNQALHALLFLYKEVLAIDLPWLNDVVRAKERERVPVVLTKEEVNAVLSDLKGTNWIIASLLYGSGLRLIEALRLRVKDIDFGYKQITVREGKGGKDRYTVLPDVVIEPLKEYLETVKILHESDLKLGLGRVKMPYALDKKYPSASCEWKWQFVFPSRNVARDPRSDHVGRHHISEIRGQIVQGTLENCERKEGRRRASTGIALNKSL